MTFEAVALKRIQRLEEAYLNKEVKITRGKFKGRIGYISSLCPSYPFTLSCVSAHVEIYYKRDKSRIIIDYAYNQHWHTLDTLELQKGAKHENR
jgi:hypothetical protein